MDDKLKSWTTEQIEMPSAKSLAFDDRYLDRSLIHIRNRRDPKIDLWSIPVSIGDHEDERPFNMFRTNNRASFHLWW